VRYLSPIDEKKDVIGDTVESSDYCTPSKVYAYISGVFAKPIDRLNMQEAAVLNPSDIIMFSYSIRFYKFS